MGTRLVDGQQSVASSPTDFDHLDPVWADDPHPEWERLRARCSVARTDRYGGFYLPLTWDAARQVCLDTRHFSSRSHAIDGSDPLPPNFAPPLTADPPAHRAPRRLLAPAFAPAAVASLEGHVLAACEQRLDILVRQGRGEIVADYARHVPAHVIARLLGIGPDVALEAQCWPVETVLSLARDCVERASRARQDGLVGMLLDSRDGGRLVDPEVVVRMVFLILAVGADTVQNVISASLWHLASHPADRERLVAEPALIPAATEEFLRFYSPVSAGRLITDDTEIAGCAMEKGRRVLLAFGAINRDPDRFADADRFVIDRGDNRHASFGIGIHRCIAEHLARMEVTTALRRWLARIPKFELDRTEVVSWTGGHFRGPKQAFVLLPGSTADAG